MTTEKICLLVYCIICVVCLIYFFVFNKKGKDNPMDDGSFYFGSLVLSCFWPIMLLIIPFILIDDRKHEKEWQQIQKDLKK